MILFEYYCPRLLLSLLRETSTSALLAAYCHSFETKVEGRLQGNLIMKAFLSKMAAVVTMGQQQPPSSQASATSRQASDPTLQPTMPAVNQQAVTASNLAMP